MRRSTALALAFALVGPSGCGKKPQPPAPEAEKATKAAPAAEAATERNKQLAGLKVSRPETRRAAIEELSWLAEDDPAVIPALLELLRDKGTAGSGHTLANQINSTREAAALAILACTKGDVIMREKGLPILREELSNPSAVLREHTAYTIGQLGPVAKPLAADVQKLCTDPDSNVRGVAFDTLRVTGVADPVGFVKLLAHGSEDVVRMTAELIPHLSDVPAEAVGPLGAALGSENSNIRAAAAEGLAVAGPKAAPAAQLLADTIKKSYPDMPDPMVKVRHDGPEESYWKALSKVGPAAVGPTITLLEHPNPLVRQFAARALGMTGPATPPAVDALKKALNDTFVNVAVEAAISLSALGAARDESLARMKLALDAPDGGIAAAAIEGIPKMGAAGESLIPLALARTADPNKQTRLAAVTLVGMLPPDQATKFAAEVGKQATDPEADVRRRVGRVLEHLGPAGAPAAGALGAALATEKESDVRDQFVEALVAMGAGAKPAVSGLLPLTANPDLSVALRARVITAVAVADPASPEVSAALVKATSDTELTIRAAAADALGKLNPLSPEALAALVKLAKSDQKYAPRVAAFRALATAGPRASAVKSEVDALTTNAQPGLALWAKVARAALTGDVNTSAGTVRAGLGDRSGQVRAAASEALVVIGPTVADLPALLKLMKDANGTTKAASATAAGRLGVAAKDAVPQLRRLLDDREVEVRIAAADALGLIGPASQPAVARLKALTADPSVRHAAQRALDKIGTK